MLFSSLFYYTKDACITASILSLQKQRFFNVNKIYVNKYALALPRPLSSISPRY